MWTYLLGYHRSAHYHEATRAAPEALPPLSCCRVLGPCRAPWSSQCPWLPSVLLCERCSSLSRPTTRKGLRSPAQLPPNSEPSPSHAAARCSTGRRAVSALEEWADHKQGWLNHSALHRCRGVSEGCTGFLFGQEPSFIHSLIH